MMLRAEVRDNVEDEGIEKSGRNRDNVALFMDGKNGRVDIESYEPKRKRKPIEPIPSTSANTSINNSSCASDTADIFDGMTKASDTSYEVWVHADCAVWASGVHLIGTRIVGLDAAVWGSTRHQCTKCQNYGAMLCCLKRGCNDSAHMPCARKSNWSLSDEDFKVMCDKHCEKVDTTVSNVAKST